MNIQITFINGKTFNLNSFSQIKVIEQHKLLKLKNEKDLYSYIGSNQPFRLDCENNPIVHVISNDPKSDFYVYSTFKSILTIQVNP